MSCLDLSCCLVAGMCAVWFKQSRTLETYQRMQLTKCHGVLELLCTFKDVGKLPTWDDTLVQVHPFAFVAMSLVLCEHV